MTIGLGFDYRESLELSMERLLSHLNLESGICLYGGLLGKLGLQKVS